MSSKTTSVCFGRARLPQALAGQLMSMPRGLRGRTVAFIVLAHAEGVNLSNLVSAAAELRRLGVLINQSLRVTRGTSVDTQILWEAAHKVKGLWP